MFCVKQHKIPIYILKIIYLKKWTLVNMKYSHKLKENTILL